MTTKICPKCAERGDKARLVACQALESEIGGTERHCSVTGSVFIPVWVCGLCNYTMSRRVYNTKKRRERGAQFDAVTKKFNLDCAA